MKSVLDSLSIFSTQVPMARFLCHHLDHSQILWLLQTADCEANWTVGGECQHQLDTWMEWMMQPWFCIWYIHHWMCCADHLKRNWNNVQGTECPGTSPSCPSLPCGQRCLYNLTSVSVSDQDQDVTIVATHQTPKHRWISCDLLEPVVNLQQLKAKFALLVL